MRSRAFTLVEVLATIALAAIVLPAVMQGINLCLTTASQARDQSQAAALAHSKMSELVAAGQIQQAVLSGDFGTDWPNYRWEAAITDWDSQGLLQLDVTVFWRQGSVDRDVKVSTLVYDYTYTGDMP